MKVLFVCTGNTCRSPMLEFMFKNYLRQLCVNGVEADSAGTVNHEKPMSSHTVTVLKAHSIPYEERLSKFCTEREMAQADLIIAMTAEQAEQLKNAYNARYFHKIHSMREIVGYDIHDPYGQGIEAYENTYKLLSGALPKLLNCIENNL